LLLDSNLIKSDTSIWGRSADTMASKDVDWKNARNIYEFTADNIKGESVALKDYSGQVCVIVNVASK